MTDDTTEARPEQDSPMWRMRVAAAAREQLEAGVASHSRNVAGLEEELAHKRVLLAQEEERLADARLRLAGAQEALDLFHLGLDAERQVEQAKP